MRSRFATTQWSSCLRQAGADLPARTRRSRVCARSTGIRSSRSSGAAVIPSKKLRTSRSPSLRASLKKMISQRPIANAADSGHFSSPCQHFLLNERDRTLALKRGGGHVAIPIDIASAESRYQRSLAHEETPEDLYQRQWCLTLLASVLDIVQSEYVDAGKGHLFARLRGFLTMDDSADTHAVAAADLHMTTAAVKVAVRFAHSRSVAEACSRSTHRLDLARVIKSASHKFVQRGDSVMPASRTGWVGPHRSSVAAHIRNAQEARREVILRVD